MDPKSEQSGFGRLTLAPKEIYASLSAQGLQISSEAGFTQRAPREFQFSQIVKVYR